jgi:hypothetical protein
MARKRTNLYGGPSDQSGKNSVAPQKFPRMSAPSSSGACLNTMEWMQSKHYIGYLEEELEDSSSDSNNEESEEVKGAVE